MKIRVAVFFGGQSTEHEISCISANQAMQALDKNKYEIIPVYIAKNKDFYTGNALFDLANYANLDELINKLEKISLVKDNKRIYLRSIKNSLFKHYEKEIDVAFPVMHGNGGEDGCLQGLFEMLDLPYTSSSVLAAAIGQDKEIMKEILSYHHLPITDWFWIDVALFDEKQEDYLTKAKTIGYPLILKPANLGSSIGIEIVNSEEEFIPKVKQVGIYDFKIVVEKKLNNFKEFNCSVLGDHQNAKTSAIEEVLHDGDILNFEDKYLKGNKKGAKYNSKLKGGMANTKRRVPALLDKEKENEIKELALAAFKVLNARGVVRIDFLQSKDGKIYINEINTIPGSLSFYLWQEVALSFKEECDELINLALKNKREKDKKVFSFDTNILVNYRREK